MASLNTTKPANISTKATKSSNLQLSSSLVDTPQWSQNDTNKAQRTTSLDASPVVSLVEDNIRENFMTKRDSTIVDDSFVIDRQFQNLFTQQHYHGKTQNSKSNPADIWKGCGEAAASETSQESEPVRPAKRRKKSEAFKGQIINSSSSPVRLPDRQTRTPLRYIYRGESTSEDDSVVRPREGIQADRVSELVTNSYTRVVVEIPIYEDLDRDAYTKVSASTQSTPSVASHISQEVSSEGNRPTYNSITRDIIPDSQDLFTSSSCAVYEVRNPRISLDIESEIINLNESSSPSSGVPALGQISSPSQTSSEIPSAQPDYSSFYPFDSQISSGSSNSLAQIDVPHPPAKSRQSSLSEAVGIGGSEIQNQISFIRDNSTIVADDLEKISQSSSVVQETSHVNRARNFHPPRDEIVATTTFLKEVLDSNSTEPWQGAQIVSELALFVTQSSVDRLGSELNWKGSHSSTERADQLVPELSKGTPAYSTNGSQNIIKETPATKKSFLHPVSPTIEYVNPCNRPGFSSQIGSHVSAKELSWPSTILQQLLNTNSDVIPTRPSTPSDSEMTDHEAMSDSSRLNYADQAKQARNIARAKYTEATRARTFLHSSQSPTLNTTHQMLPVRENSTLSASQPAHVDDVPGNQELPSSFGNADSQLVGAEIAQHVVWLPLPSMVRDIYTRTVVDCKHIIEAFINTDEDDPLLMEQVDTMIEKLKMIADHQDLIDNDASSTQMSEDLQAKWATICSSKCLFLQNLLDKMRLDKKHIIILARPGRMLDILELILKERGHVYDRPEKRVRSNHNATGPLTVTILPTSTDGGKYSVRRADLVIAFDGTFRSVESYPNVLQTDGLGKALPLISFVVANSAEHIDLALPKNVDPIERKVSLVTSIAKTRLIVGNFDMNPEHLLPEEAAVAVAGYLQGGIDNGLEWPLQQNFDIPDLEIPNEIQTQVHSDPNTSLQSHHSTHQLSSQGAMKRSLRTESIGGTDADSTKRMRMTPVPVEITSSGDVTRVSDSLGHQSRLKSSSADAANDPIAQVNALDEEQSGQITFLLDKVADLENQVRSKQSTEERLHQLVKDLESRLEDHIKTIKKFQPKFQQAIADRGKFQAERNAAQAQATAFDNTIQARIADITTLKEEKINLEAELRAAREALCKSAVPEMAKLVEAQDQVRDLLAGKEHLEKNLSNVQQNYDYTRDIYQKASSTVIELRNEANDLKAENVALQRKASENLVRIAEIQHTSEAKEREERIEELEAILKNREQELHKKYEELKIKTNGRRETRGTSVPRSPRLVSGAMSPRPQFARTAGGSRGGSPAPGDSRDAFRDPPLFPPSGLGSSRWTHLT